MSLLQRPAPGQPAGSATSQPAGPATGPATGRPAALRLAAGGLPPQCLAHVHSAVLLVDAHLVLHANPAAERLFGLADGLADGAADGLARDALAVPRPADGNTPVPGLAGRTVASLLAPDWRARLLPALQQVAPGPVAAPHDICCLRPDGSLFDARMWAEPLQLDGRTVHLVTLNALSELRQAQRRIEELVNFDEITGLANRANLLLRIAAAQRAAERDGQQLALLAIEVPRITELASSMGFGAADALAMAVAARLRQQCAVHEQVAHLGGAEFALLSARLPQADPPLLLQRAASLRQALQQPVPLGGAEILPRCRIGIARFPLDGRTAAALLEAAQTACGHAHGSGLADLAEQANPAADAGSSSPTGVAFYQWASNARALRDMQIESALRHALQRQEFTLLYQPQVCLTSGNIIGAEALLRWQSADCGAVPPDEFIPVAERTGLIAGIGDWVIHQACRQIAQWRAQGLPALRVGVNISPVQFQLGDVAASIHRALAATGAPASALGVELTESALLHDGERVAATLHALKASGIEIALDDFGTGFSSLGRLRTLPIDLLKIDRCFVSDVTAAPESASLTRSIINLAHGLQIPVLAEGVETEGQLHMLAANGCDRLQGYLFSRPVPADTLAAMLRDGRQLRSHLAQAPVRSRTLLLVDDEPSILSALKRLFRRDGYRVLTAANGLEALELLATSAVDVIVSDQRMPGISGVEFLRRAKALYPDTIRMTLSGFTDLQSIIDAVNEGAVYKFLIKPWDDERLREHVAQAFTQKELADENRRLQREVGTANADLAGLNQRLALLLDQQRAQAALMQASADGVRDLLDLLPAAVFGVDTDGMLAYLNQPAAQLLPEALAGLGGGAVPALDSLLAQLHLAPHAAVGHPVQVRQQAHRAWLKPMPLLGVQAPHDAIGDSRRGMLLVLLPEPQQACP